MSEFFTGTLVVDGIIVLTLLEWAALYGYFRSTGKGVAPRNYTLNLVSGLFLMLALRTVLAGGPGPFMAISLACAGIAHSADMWRRWQT